MLTTVISVFAVLCSYAYLPVKANNGYLVAAPMVFRPGVTERISVTIFNATEPVPVKATLVLQGQKVAFSQEIIFGKGTVTLEVPTTVRGKARLTVCGNCDLQAGGFTFHNYTTVTVDEKGSSVFIQTDRPVYKPSQTVQINVISVGPDLRPINDEFEAYIVDPKESRMIQWKDLKPICCGIVNMSFPISDQPVLGEWMVFVESGGITYNKTFEIQKYVLPKFEVVIDPPPYVVDTDSCYDIGVTARYTYGELVKGKLTVRTNVLGTGYYKYKYQGQPDTQLMDIDGSASYTVCIKSIVGMELSDHFRGVLYIEATVTSIDGSTSTAVEDSVPVHKQLAEIEFSKDTRKHFKPGLPYKGKIHVFYADKSPADGITVRVKADLSSGDNFYTKEFISKNGFVNFEIRSLPTRAQIVWIDAKIIAIDGEEVGENYYPTYMSISSWYAPSKCHIMLESMNDGDLQVGDKAEVLVISTCPCNFTLHYEIISRSNIVLSGSHDSTHHLDKREAEVVTFINGQPVQEGTTVPNVPTTPTSENTCTTQINFDVTYEMAPITRLLVYYVRENDEGVADSMQMTVTPKFENQISMSLSKEKLFPGEKVDITVNAKPGSCVCLAAVDKSVHLMKPGYQLNMQHIIDELEEYDVSNGNNEDNIFGMFYERKKRSLLSWLSQDAKFAFVETGLTVMTDSVMLNHRQESTLHGGADQVYTQPDYVQSLSGATQSYSNIPKSERRRRSFFPETWIWRCFNTSSTRKQDTVRVKVPDTITSWMIDAVTVSRQYGLGIADSTSIKTFKPFFVEFTIPYSVVRGEQVKLPLTIFNYLDVCIEVHLSIHVPFGVRFLTHSNRRMTKKFCLQPRETLATSTIVVFEELGHKNITAHAEARESVDCCQYGNSKYDQLLLAVDKLSRQIMVEAEGIPRYYTHSVFFCPNERIHISTPNNYEYQYVELPPEITFFTFTVKAENDVHLALSALPQDLPAMYEIVIGGFQNMDSWLARSKQGEHEVDVRTKNILSWDEFRAFWICWEDGNIQVGYGNTHTNESVFLTWQDEEPLPVMYIGFSTGWGSLGEFKIWKKENLDSTFSEVFNLGIPLNVVPGSERADASIIGDVMGPTLNNLHNLLRLPFGCGEQNMIHFAPNVYVLRYLKRTLQLTPETETEALQYLIEGYQRQLTYKRYDGSYSAFGERDSAGSMWLTAFVLKSFAQSRSFIYIDPKELEESVTWIIKHQKKDGCFPAVGRVLNKDIQGGLKGRISLTAYVLMSLLEVGMTGERETNAIELAQEFLENKVATGQVTDPYTAALTAYALTTLKSSQAGAAIRKLNSFAIKRDGFTYWRFSGHPLESAPLFEFNDGLKQSMNSAEVEMTAYGLLTYTVMGDVASALPVVKWLSKQRNSLGGFSSTQDTCVALQGLSEYAILAYIGGVNVSINVASTNLDYNNVFILNKENSEVLQTDRIPSIPTGVFVRAKGDGCALLQIDVSYNIPDPTTMPAFQLDVKIQERRKEPKKPTLNKKLSLRRRRAAVEEEFTETNELTGENYKVTIEACTRWLHYGSSNMAVVEVALLTGFRPDIESLEKLVLSKNSGIKRYEVDGRKVFFYFDEIPSECLTCVSFEAYRDYIVGKTKPVPVRIYDYYEPRYEATKFYNVSRNSPLSQELCEGSLCNEVREETFSAFSTHIEESPEGCNSLFGCPHFREDNFERCACVHECDDSGTPVCGSDGNMYPNLCKMEVDSCKLNMELISMPLDECGEDEEEGSGSEEGSGVILGEPNDNPSDIPDVTYSEESESSEDSVGLASTPDGMDNVTVTTPEAKSMDFKPQTSPETHRENNENITEEDASLPKEPLTENQKDREEETVMSVNPTENLTQDERENEENHKEGARDEGQLPMIPTKKSSSDTNTHLRPEFTFQSEIIDATAMTVSVADKEKVEPSKSVIVTETTYPESDEGEREPESLEKSNSDEVSDEKEIDGTAEDGHVPNNDEEDVEKWRNIPEVNDTHNDAKTTLATKEVPIKIEEDREIDTAPFEFKLRTSRPNPQRGLPHAIGWPDSEFYLQDEAQQGEGMENVEDWPDKEEEDPFKFEEKPRDVVMKVKDYPDSIDDSEMDEFKRVEDWPEDGIGLPFEHPLKEDSEDSSEPYRHHHSLHGNEKEEKQEEDKSNSNEKTEGMRPYKHEDDSSSEEADDSKELFEDLYFSMYYL
ncbi:C3 and PZP-like alpha-2-macroglobulin domain-containing protein 8 [Glandiceps talaboti]